MAYYRENYNLSSQNNVPVDGSSWQTRIIEAVNLPNIHRCPMLGMQFDSFSNRELQDMFPFIVNSIFNSNGGNGWGLRTITKETSPLEFDALYNFFVPLGPLFRLFYRLLNDAIKFELNPDLLPSKMKEMLHTGQFAPFYADLISFDPFRRCGTTLSLNAFDYFILNFAIYGTQPLHRKNPAALAVHNDKLKTVYFYLAADYLCFFLPANPDTVILPTNICSTVKTPQPMPAQPLQPTRSPKYLLSMPVSHFTSKNPSHIRPPEMSRAHAWRTESVLYLFVDTWLRFDVDEMIELPSSEFIRVVRVLVKQVHSFGNSAEMDNTSMIALRKMAQPMMSTRIYTFLKSIIARWPLDCSLLVVLELWLSYIQPWRYHCNRDTNSMMDMPIDSRYETFIVENLVIYTQIFNQFLNRFKLLDLTSYRNALMFHRLTKVFSQTTLSHLLQRHETRMMNNLCTVTSRHSSPRKDFRMSLKPNYSEHCDIFRTDQSFNESNYVCMFGDEYKIEIENFLRKLYIARLSSIEDMETIQCEIEKKNRRFFSRIIHNLVSVFDEPSSIELKLQEIQKIVAILQISIQSLSTIFEVNVPEVSECDIEPRLPKTFEKINFSTSFGNDSSFDISHVSPWQMRDSINHLEFNIDPAVLPIRSVENTFLVRILFKFANHLNRMFSDEINMLWSRRDILGKIMRHVLNPPITVQHFDKSKATPELRHINLPPRICLRFLGSYFSLGLIIFALIGGHVMWGYSSLGFLLLITIIFLYILFLALFD